jgi:hypothetical protein
MLDVHFFANPRFSAASGAITLTFFAMFGAMFLLTQYLQFVLGYSPLETGVRLLPLAFTMMITAPLSPRLAERIGTKLTVALGLGLVTAAFLLYQGLTVDSSYGEVAWRLMVMAVGMGLTMAPATESIMGSLPLAKAGVGSAVNDTTRQVGGALGVAVIGSVLATVYGDKITDVLSGTAAPPEAVEAASSSLGGAFTVAEQARAAGTADTVGLAERLLATANAAFVDAMHAGVLVAASATALGVVVVLAFLPARARARDEVRQHAEFAAEHAHDRHVPADVLTPETADQALHHAPAARPVLAPAPEAAAE